MIKDFQSFINEAITLKREGGAHYLERVNTRLSQLEIVGFTNNKGDKIEVSNAETSQAQSFFREALANIADPNKSKIFSETDIKPGHIGIIRLGKPKVTLDSGEVVEPVFKVYERTDSTTNKPVFRTGKCFWLFTIGSQVSTIKLYNVDGNTPSEKTFLINKSIEHMVADRQAELEKISRVFSVKLDSKEALEKRHTIVLTPSGISIVSLNFKSGDAPAQQLTSFLKDSTTTQQEIVQFIPDPNRESSVSLEMVPKQMNVTPNKVWLLEQKTVEGVDTWGALPILQSKQVTGPYGSEIQIKLGKKWLHWFETPIFNTPLQIDRVIKKGDTVTLAKEIGNGNWLANTGVITDIATDLRSSEFPYVKTNGWASSIIIGRENAEKIFVDFRKTNESISPVLSFKQWTLSNLR
ncbi:hypothetical protein UFOVP972_196 [uncultured Caudovirales phage]|uniref:Uncharacterized protein n=1 Tax=uncultured Caudovirales phage TaxID=2100421 RepID=A0A6J5Q1I8_9CAUD|nr:hypothetical protein UFOVP972_196 [uncultured Caudovirales phage]